MSTVTYPNVNGYYRHYKGGVYQVLFLSKHTETGDTLVNYKSLHFGTYQSRPLDVWNEKIQHDNRETPRFKYIVNHDYKTL